MLLRLLHAVPEQREEDESSVLQQELISALADVYQTSRGADNKKAKKREKASSQFFFCIFQSFYEIKLNLEYWESSILTLNITFQYLPS